MICMNCGREIGGEESFCKYCGAPQKQLLTTPYENQDIMPLQQSVVYQYVAPVTNNGVGIVALVLGIIGIFTWLIFVPSLLAVILGIVGIATKDKEHSCGCAIAGLVLGLVEVVPTIFLLIAAF